MRAAACASRWNRSEIDGSCRATWARTNLTATWMSRARWLATQTWPMPPSAKSRTSCRLGVTKAPTTRSMLAAPRPRIPKPVAKRTGVRYRRCMGPTRNEAFERARARWPGVELGFDAWAAHLDALGWLEEVPAHADSLFLCCAC